jgi:ParB family chromosome partitioning protein
MPAPKRGLGRGLGALLQTSVEETAQGQTVEQIALKSIVPNPYQPRRTFSTESIKELADSIAENSLLQPILLRKTKDQYEIVNGERRFRAFEMLKRDTIPARVTEINDQEMLVWALIENIQRENLNPVEEAISYQKLAQTFQLTHEQLAQSLGKSRAHVTNSLRLLKLPKELLNYVESGLLSPGGARALLTVDGEEKQKKAALEAIHMGYNVRQIEKYVKDIQNPASSSAKNEEPTQEGNSGDMELTQQFSHLTGMDCKFHSGRNKSKLEILFKSKEEIEKLMDLLKRS